LAFALVGLLRAIFNDKDTIQQLNIITVLFIL
jgi:hypothetical protein